MIYVLAIAYVLTSLGVLYVGLAANGNEQDWSRPPADSTPEQVGHPDHIPNHQTPEQRIR